MIIKKILPAIGILLGLIMTLYPWISEYLYENRVDSIVENVTEEIASTSDEDKQEMLQEARIYNESVLDAKVELTDPFNKESGADEDSYESTLDYDESGVMAFIEIPKIKVNLPIYHGTSDEVLAQGVGHLEGSSLPIGGEGTHCVLSGHTGMNSARLFTDLPELEKGDLFFINILGDTLAYRVCEISIVTPDNTTPLVIQNGRDLVTLVTCTPYGVNSHRLFVTGERTEYSEPEYVMAVASGNSVDSEWMRQYKKAITLGLGIVLVCAFLLAICKKIFQKGKVKHNNSVDAPKIPPAAMSH